MTDEQIKELFGVVPYFANTRIEAFQPAHFIRSMSHCDSASVNIGLIYGTSHPAYQGMTWREFLGHGEKMKKNLSRFTVNPEYYLSRERSDMQGLCRRRWQSSRLYCEIFSLCPCLTILAWCASH